jgi:tetratricopeptide (TPR) repeat protein
VWALSGLSATLGFKGDLAGALAAAEQARDLAIELGEPSAVASAHLDLGMAWWRLGAHERSLEHCRRSLEAAPSGGRSPFGAGAHVVAALIELERGSETNASGVRAGLDVVEQLGFRWASAMAWTRLGLACREPVLMRECAGRAAPLAGANPHVRFAADLVRLRADVWAHAEAVDQELATSIWQGLQSLASEDASLACLLLARAAGENAPEARAALRQETLRRVEKEIGGLPEEVFRSRLARLERLAGEAALDTHARV